MPEGKPLPAGLGLEGVEVRRQGLQQEQIPLELEELHLVQWPLTQHAHGAADVPQLHEPLPEAGEGRVVPQGHGLVQVIQLSDQGRPLLPAIGSQGPLPLPAQRRQGQKPVQHEGKADILLLFGRQFHSNIHSFW